LIVACDLADALKIFASALCSSVNASAEANVLAVNANEPIIVDAIRLFLLNLDIVPNQLLLNLDNKSYC
jgi:hypothetical protein